MAFVLVVTRPFGAYRIGDVVAEDEPMQEILHGAHVHDVIRVSTPLLHAAVQEGA